MTTKNTNLSKIAIFDKGDVFKTYENTHKQFDQVFGEFKISSLKNKFKDINKVLICGMGGSALGADLVRNVFCKNIKLPILVLNDYNLPAWVDNKTLIVISSFSGTTEESIQCFKNARKRKMNIYCIGGKTFDISNTSGYLFDPKYNFAQNPRFAIGYSIASMISLFIGLNILKFDLNDIKKGTKYFSIGKETTEKFAKNILNKIPIIVASEHLFGNAHVFQNQLNETGKIFSTHFQMPEICHHQFEGLGSPKDLNKNIIYVLINSKLYDDRNQKRYNIFKEILSKKKIKFIEIIPKGLNVWDESMYVLGLSSYISFYLAYFNNIDPQPNPWVDYLKKRMRE
ncbi:MAG: SIS domain-containing protein [Patescibacteria group bacterium]|nr:SIS domain-containing protein [Patescibacteria group bacterium]MDD4303948.1 SIS domain-containing protein [Patescibacteria group bacterium]MDD4695064.1 SIS domain-containing protein [Patescibacteria group bacterium]